MPSVVFVSGGAVNGGVYDCDGTTWADGNLLSKSGRYVACSTDIRETFSHHLGPIASRMDTVMPGYDQAVLDNPSDFTLRGII